jgi:hypothetical protein
VTRNAVDWRALAAAAHAADILRQEPIVNLALIGFVEPPLPTLLQLPFVWLLPEAAQCGQTVWLLGALVGGLTVLLLNGACAGLGVGRPWRWVLCALVTLNPVFLGLAALGAPDGLYVLLLLGAGWALLRWQRDARLRDLISGSLYLSFACLTRYDAVLVAGVAAAVVSYTALRRGGRWAQLEGTLITFLLPVAYLSALWVLANWLILGDAWHFWREAWRPPWSGRVPFMGEPVMNALVACTPLLGALWWAVWGGACGRPRLALGPAVTLLSPAAALAIAPGPLRLWVDHAQTSRLPLQPVPELLAPALAACLLLVPAMLGDLVPIFSRKTYAKEVCLAGAAALLALAALYLTEPANRAYVSPRATLSGLPLTADDAGSTRSVAARLAASPPGNTLVVAGWPGYAVTLYAGRTSGKVLLPAARPPAEPIKARPVGGLLVRDRSLGAYPEARSRWETQLGARLGTTPAWVEGEWAYWEAKPARRR